MSLCSHTRQETGISQCISNYKPCTMEWSFHFPLAWHLSCLRGYWKEQCLTPWSQDLSQGSFPYISSLMLFLLQSFYSQHKPFSDSLTMDSHIITTSFIQYSMVPREWEPLIYPTLFFYSFTFLGIAYNSIIVQTVLWLINTSPGQEQCCVGVG